MDLFSSDDPRYIIEQNLLESLFLGRSETILFVDSITAEIIQWNLGRETIVNYYDHVSLCMLEDGQPDRPLNRLKLENEKKKRGPEASTFNNVVFFLGSHLSVHLLEILKLFKSGLFADFSIFCTLSDQVQSLSHSEMLDRNGSCYGYISEQFSGISVEYLPVGLCFLLPDVVVSPTRKHSLNPEVVDVVGGVENLLKSFDLMVDECLTLGNNSKKVGQIIVDKFSCDNEKNNEDSQTTVVVIDRMLDLVACTWHGGTFLDEVYTCLPRVGYTDVYVDVSEFHTHIHPSVCSLGDKISLKESVPKYAIRGSLVRGRYSSSTRKSVDQLMEIFSSYSEKPCISKLFLFVADALDSSKFSKGLLAPPTSRKQSDIKRLGDIAKCLFGVPKLIPMVDFILAAVKTLQHSKSNLWDHILGIEKILYLSLGDVQQNLARQLVEAIEFPILGTSHHRKLTFDDSLILCIFIYSLMGHTEFPLSDIAIVTKTLQKKLKIESQSQVESELSFEKGDDSFGSSDSGHLVESFMDKLDIAKNLRNDYVDFCDLYSQGSYEYISLARQVASNVFPAVFSNSPFSRDFHRHRRTGKLVESILKTGWSRFGFGSSAAPIREQSEDNAVNGSKCVIFVFSGGFTFEEARSIKKIAEKFCHQKKKRVFILGTTICTSKNVLQYFK